MTDDASTDLPETITAEKITEVLRADGHDVTVTAVDATPVGTGQMAASYRVALTVDGDRGDLPETLVAKTAFGPIERRQISAGSFGVEIQFYRTFADRIGARIPHCWASWATDDHTDFLLLLEDLAPREQGDQLLGCTVEEAKVAAANLAGLHGPLWNDPWLAEHLLPYDEAQKVDLDSVMPIMCQMFLQRYGDRISAETASVYERIDDKIGSWMLDRPAPFGPVHGDYRLDNLLFAPDGSDVAAVDWQTVSLGLPGRDLGYFVATSLSVEDRRRAGDEIVAAYHEALVGHGVADYDLATCHEDHVYGMLQAPMVIVFGSAVATPTERGDEMFIAMAERSSAAILELGTLDLLA